MGRPSSSSPDSSSASERFRAQPRSRPAAAPKTTKREGDRQAELEVTAVHAEPVDLPSYAPRDPTRVSQEQPGRYAYTSPDGEAGSELGRGGIGRVLLAIDEHLGREVAIKELLAPGGSAPAEDAERARRFLAEARITGQLEHPNIVPVYELGRRPDGKLYYTMRVVRGSTMSAALERADDLEERLALLPHFAGLCNAIAYAHSRGVVHRDIKPENVMIGEFGETVVLDWGIAQVRGAPEAQHSGTPRGVAMVGQTAAGGVVGTPLFMSPEQARGQTDEIDASTDVWALGVVLYQLLCGRLPFTGKNADEVVQRVLGGRRTPVRRAEPRAPSELAAVAERALRTDKSLRYPSVRQLAGDIDAFMSGARVAAYEYSTLELFRRFYRRHRTAALVAMIATVSLVVVAFDFQRRVLRARDRALAAEEKALEKERIARSSLAEVFAERAVGAVSEGDAVGAAVYGARALELGERADARGSLVGETNQPTLLPVARHPELGNCQHYAASRFGDVACWNGPEVRIWSRRGGVRRFRLDSPARQLALSGDGQALVALRANGSLTQLDRHGGSVVKELSLRLPQGELLRLSDDGERVATADGAGRAAVHELSSGRLLAETELTQAVSSLGFSPGGERVLLGGRLGLVASWNLASGVLSTLQGHRGTVTAVAFSNRGDRLATAASDRTLSLFSGPRLTRLAPPLRNVGTVLSLGWSPDDRWLIAGTDDRMLGLVDVRKPRNMRRFRGHPTPLRVARFQDATTVVSVSPKHGLRVWSRTSAPLPPLLSARGNVLAQAFHGAGTLATAGLPQHGVCLWHLASERCRATLPVRSGQVRALAVDPAKERLAVGTSEGRIMIWNLASNLPERVLSDVEGQVRSLEFSDDGASLLSASRERGAALWQIHRGVLVRRFAEDATPSAARLDLRHERALLATRRGTLEAWTLDGHLHTRAKASADWLMDLALHADSDRLVTAGGDGRITFWKASTLEALGSASASEGRTLSIALSPDGRLAATAGEDGMVIVWSVVRQSRLAVLPHHRGVARSVEFSPDGRFLTSGGDDASVRIWDLSRLAQPGRDALPKAEARYWVGLDGTKIKPNAMSDPP